MYKDFKKSETLDTGFTSGSSLIWMFSGIVLGLLVGLGMYFFSNDKMPRVSMIDSLEKKIQKVQTANPEQTKKIPNLTTQKTNQQILQIEDKERKNKFSYYAVLPNLDVPIDSAKPINTSTAATSLAADKTTQNSLTDQYKAAVEIQNKKIDEEAEASKNPGDYLLQVASFKKQSMANRTRGRLSKKGIDAYVQKKKVKGKYWYRVVAGPVDQISVDNWKHTAEKLGHKPLVISVVR